MVVEERRNLFSRYVNGRTFSQDESGFWTRVKLDMINSYKLKAIEINEIKPNFGQAIVYCALITFKILLAFVLCSLTIFYTKKISVALNWMIVNSLAGFLLIFVFLMILDFLTAIILKSFILDENNIKIISFVRMALHSQTTFPLILFLTTFLSKISDAFDIFAAISLGFYFFVSDHHIKESIHKSKRLTSIKQSVFITILTFSTSILFFLLYVFLSNKVFL